VVRVLRQALDVAWGSLVSGNTDKIPAAIASCDALLPAEEDEEEADAYTEDATAAVTHSLKAVAELDPRAPMWAARRGIDFLDTYIQAQTQQTEESMSWAPWDHPLFQAEIERRGADLETLAGEPFSRAVESLRRRAGSSSVIPPE
jgi:hypothetical protein